MDDRMAAHKPDWAESRQRMIDWWASRKTDRVPGFITAPRAEKVLDKEWNSRLPDKFIDPEVVFHNLEIQLANRFWGAEAFPQHFVYMGAMFPVTFLGAEPKFHNGGAWYESPFGGWEDADRICFDRENRWWKIYAEIRRRSAERSEGRYFTTVGGIGAAMDVFAELFGTQETLMAMVDRPDEMLRLRDRIVEWGKVTYDEAYETVSQYQPDGSVDGMQVWAPGRVRTLQCDLCVTFSPEMFAQFVTEELRVLFEHVDYGIYHLDGEEQEKHLDMLLALDSLDLIQFVPVTKKSDPLPRDPMKHLDLFRRILEGGKKVYIICPPERVEPLLNAIPREGVFLSTYCPDEETARRTLATLDRIGV